MHCLFFETVCGVYQTNLGKQINELKSILNVVLSKKRFVVFLFQGRAQIKGKSLSLAVLIRNDDSDDPSKRKVMTQRGMVLKFRQ